MLLNAVLKLWSVKWKRVGPKIKYLSSHPIITLSTRNTIFLFSKSFLKDKDIPIGPRIQSVRDDGDEDGDDDDDDN